MAKATSFFEAYRSAQNSLVGLKIAVLDVINGHRAGISAKHIGQLLGLAPASFGEHSIELVSSVLRVMEMEGTIFQGEGLWKATDIT